jgi:amidohydrolase
MEDGLLNKIKREMNLVYPEAVKFRHLLHRYPEESSKEYRTADFIEKVLQEWEIPYRRVANGTAVIAQIQGTQAGSSCIALRADMDALPLEENVDVPYRSEHSGFMHACGHDLHMANLLAVGIVLKKLQPCFAGTIKLFFQPAEEIGEGAQKLVAAGALESPKVEAVLAAHVSEALPVGDISVKPAESTLACSNFRISLSSPGGHASAPDKTADIVLAAAKIILELQSIPGRKISHLEPAVITVTSIHGGTCSNVIPKELVLMGTIRTLRNSLQKDIYHHIETVLRAEEQLTGVKAEAAYCLRANAVYNDENMTKRFFAYTQKLLGEEKVKLSREPFNASEDFYVFSNEVPAVFYLWGVSRQPAEAAPLHSPLFTAEDEALKTGILAMTGAALDFLSEETAIS